MDTHMNTDNALYHASDIAEYILGQTGPITAMKLQKLVYYCQAWSLVWDERPLFSDDIEAWKNGPVVRTLFAQHRGQFLVHSGTFNQQPLVLDQEARETIDSVIKYYGSRTAQWLSDLSHAEDPWIEARQNVNPNENSNTIITLGSMHSYYSGLLSDES